MGGNTMNALSANKMKLDLLRISLRIHSLITPGAARRYAITPLARVFTPVRNTPPRSGHGYRLGEAVYHGLFGSGRVISHVPDGRLLVRFERSGRNRLVFPSFLGWADHR
jgi:hypothetical protein